MNVEDTVIAKGVTSKRKRDEGTNRNPDRKKETRVLGILWTKRRTSQIEDLSLLVSLP